MKDELRDTKTTYYLVPEVFIRSKREERERSDERKPLVAGDANLTIMLR